MTSPIFLRDLPYEKLQELSENDIQQGRVKLEVRHKPPN